MSCARRRPRSDKTQVTTEEGQGIILHNATLIPIAAKAICHGIASLNTLLKVLTRGKQPLTVCSVSAHQSAPGLFPVRMKSG